ncbi:hypothetical protein T10_8098 [Trichinella papuae]|uniref:Uncharacterized protein n=1 Tax=Trichinella papuae TaxID=268474 RepID=A0A0V1MMN6_9BILA|nr:hypothetical protein T10_8098 [Trichinella papuae]
MKRKIFPLITVDKWISSTTEKKNQSAYGINVQCGNAFNDPKKSVRWRCFLELESIEVIDESSLDMESMELKAVLSHQWHIPMDRTIQQH